jgi:invasion protein IalB
MKAALIAALNAQLLLSGAGLELGGTPEPLPGLQAEIFGDWAVVCGTPPADVHGRMCEITTMIAASGETAPLVRVALLRPEQNKPMRLMAIVAAAVSIAPGVNFALAPGEPGINLTYKYCAAAACFADAELAEEQIVLFRNRPRGGRLAFSDPAGNEVEVEVSFRGFDQALDALLKR